MLRIIPAKRTAQSPAFQRPILMRKQRRERMTVKRGVVKMMTMASPRGRNTRHLGMGHFQHVFRKVLGQTRLLGFYNFSK